MARILNLETATTNCSVSLAVMGEVVAIKEQNTPNYSHSEQLHLFIQEVLDEASVAMDEIDAIAVSKGPGSYTGLRIGVSAAKGLCFALGKPLLSVATLRSMALQHDTDADFIVPLLDARRMEVYAAVFDAKGNQIRQTTAEIITPDSFCEYSKNGKVHLLGTGALKCREVLKHRNFSFDTAVVPSANDMAGLSFGKFQNQEFEDVAYFEPFYLKDFIIPSKKA